MICLFFLIVLLLPQTSCTVWERNNFADSLFTIGRKEMPSIVGEPFKRGTITDFVGEKFCLLFFTPFNLFSTKVYIKKVQKCTVFNFRDVSLMFYLHIFSSNWAFKLSFSSEEKDFKTVHNLKTSGAIPTKIMREFVFLWVVFDLSLCLNLRQ